MGKTNPTIYATFSQICRPLIWPAPNAFPIFSRFVSRELSRAPLSLPGSCPVEFCSSQLVSRRFQRAPGSIHLSFGRELFFNELDRPKGSPLQMLLAFPSKIIGIDRGMVGVEQNDSSAPYVVCAHTSVEVRVRAREHELTCQLVGRTVRECDKEGFAKCHQMLVPGP